MTTPPRDGYAQLSTTFWRSPKTLTLLRTNPTALGYFPLLLSWSSDNHTGGFLPENVITALFAVPDDALAALVSAGFLEQTPDGYEISDDEAWKLHRSKKRQTVRHS